ncbi:MAG: hypothetical protein ABIP58_08540 [Dehalococcoidia bacterium]
MSRRTLVVVAVLTLAVAGVLAVACSSGTGTEESGASNDAGDQLTQTVESGGVTVDARWLTADGVEDVDADLSAYPLDRFVAVEISFTTHSGDLNKITMEEAATLQTGTETIRPETWVSVSNDSHHREGVIVFEGTAQAGPVELLLDLQDGEKVSLQWQSAPGT